LLSFSWRDKKSKRLPGRTRLGRPKKTNHQQPRNDRPAFFPIQNQNTSVEIWLMQALAQKNALLLPQG